MTDEQDPVAIALDVGARLDRLGVVWLVGGSLASSVHGEPRATQDVDIVAALLAGHVKSLVKALGRDYYVDVDEINAAVKAAGSFNAIHFASAIKADFFVAGDDPFEAERLANRLSVELPGGVLYVDTAEHTMLRKLEVSTRGRSLGTPMARRASHRAHSGRPSGSRPPAPLGRSARRGRPAAPRHR